MIDVDNYFKNLERASKMNTYIHKNNEPARKSNFLAVLSFVSIISAGIFVLYNNEGSPSSSIRSGSKHHESLTSLIKLSNSDTSLLSDINFSLKRVGYESLKYFNRKLTDIPKYKFLTNFDAIIEPNVNMELHFYDEQSVFESGTDQKFVFNVCTSGDQSICKESTYYKSISGDRVSGSIRFECEAFDTFDITLYEVDTVTQKVFKEAKGKAVCLQVNFISFYF